MSIVIAKADVVSDEFNQRILSDDKFSSYPYLEERNDIAVFYEFSWDKKKQIIKFKRNKDNYPVVRFSLFNKKDILPGSIVKKYNDIDLSAIDDKQIKKMHKKSSTTFLTLINNSKISLESKPYKLSNIELTNFWLDYVNNIDNTRGILEVTFQANFLNKRPELNKYAKGLLKNDKLNNDKKISFIDHSLNQEINKQIISLGSTNLDILYAKNLKFKIIDNKTIEFNQTNNTDWIVIRNTDLKNLRIIFKGSKKGIHNTGLNDNNITNCLTFFNVNFENTKLLAKDNYCEDAINIIASKGNIENIEINNSKFDALDVDFSKIKIDTLKIDNAGNDCVDFSHGEYYIAEIVTFECGDKAISVGENSIMNINDLNVNFANFGVASKDSSITNIATSIINNTKYCLAAYNKKKEFNGGYLKINDNNCKNYINYTMEDNLSKIVFN